MSGPQQSTTVAPLQIPPQSQMSLNRIQTGYASNTRPVVHYTPEADEDSGLRELCDPKLHFSTRTQRDFDTMRRCMADRTERTMRPKAWGTNGAEYAAAKYAAARAAPTRTSGYRAQVQHTLPTSKEVDPPQTLTTESRSNFQPAQLYPSHKLPGTLRGSKNIHPTRSSAFTNNLQTNAFEPTQAKPETASETRTRFAQARQKEFHLPPLVKHPSQFEYGQRTRPCFLPPSSRQVYGEPVKVDKATTARLAKRDPAEHFNRTAIRSTTTWTQANFGDKHREAMDEGRRLLDTNRHLLQNTQTKQSGFVRNVDIFNVEPDDTRERFRTTTRMDF